MVNRRTGGAVLLLVILQCLDIIAAQRASEYCPDERTLANGYVTYSVGEFYSQTQLETGVRKTFSCFRGWSIRGVSQSQCINGRWTARTPICVVDSCETLREEVNNYYTVYYSTEPVRGKYSSGTTAHIYCNPDTILVSGDGYPTCIAGSWLPEIPLCLHRDLVDESCILEESDIPDGVRITQRHDIKKGGVVNHFGVLEFGCVPGYTLEGASTTTCLDGEWSKRFPVCRPVEGADYESCGQTSGYTQSRGSRGSRVRRLVGGQDARDATWPWQVAIYWKRTEDNMWVFLCGGSLVSREWVLSAAHCFRSDENIQHLQVRLGLTHRVRHSGNAREQILSIDGVYLPKYYNFVGFDFDASLLHLSRQAALNPYVRTVCLPEIPTGSNYATSVGLIKPNVYGMVTGWGHTSAVHFHNATNSDGRTYTKKLQQLEVPIKTNKACTNYLKRQGENPAYFTERMFCAGYSKRARGPCFGDSGGPVVVEIQTPGNVSSSEVRSKWVQIGIVSNTFAGCGLKGAYTFYTHVPLLMDWIDSVLHTNHTPSEYEIYIF